jgi:hypothetical protein
MKGVARAPLRTDLHHGLLEDCERTCEIVRPEHFSFIPNPLCDDGSVQ